MIAWPWLIAGLVAGLLVVAGVLRAGRVRPPEGGGPVGVVVIDPGHGGRDPGAVYAGVRESHLVLAIAQRVRAEIEGLAPGVTVRMTREDDSWVSLAGRVEFARAAGAGVFVSIHCNAAVNPDAHGGEVWHGSGAGSVELARGVGALWEEAHSDGSLPIRWRRVIDGSHFAVLRGLPDRPAVLVECGFMSNPLELLHLRDPVVQARIARLVAAVIVGVVSR